MSECVRIPKYPPSEYVDMEMPSDDMDVYLRNVHSHLVKCRKDHTCLYCGAPIGRGEYSLLEQGFMDDEPFAIHYCLACVEEVMDVWTGKMEQDEAYEEWQKRYDKYYCRKGDMSFDTPEEAKE